MAGEIVFSVAHSSAHWGATAEDGLREYAVSRVASFVAAKSLAGDFPVAVLDCGPIPTDVEMANAKIASVNGLKPKCAIEIHCNASTDRNVRYSEVIYHPQSPAGKMLGDAIAAAFMVGFGQGNHMAWPRHGARANSVEMDLHRLFFLERTACPSVIVEGVFISNDEQATWLRNGGDEAYGLMVADGVRRFLSRQT